MAPFCSGADKRANGQEAQGLDHTTVWRWVQCYAPEVEQRTRRNGNSPAGHLWKLSFCDRGRNTFVHIGRIDPRMPRKSSFLAWLSSWTSASPLTVRLRHAASGTVLGPCSVRTRRQSGPISSVQCELAHDLSVKAALRVMVFSVTSSMGRLGS